jgi:hypothetical protein
MNDTQLEFAWGVVVEVEERSPAWARVRLDDGRCLTAFDPGLSGRRDTSSPGGMRPGDRVCILVQEGSCLIAENEGLTSRRDEPGSPRPQ